MAALFNFLAPILFVLFFYLLLGIVIWWIFHPPQIRLRWPLEHPLWLQNLAGWLPADAVSRQTVRIALPLLLCGILGLLLPLALPLRLLAAQAVTLAILLPWFDHYYKQRQSHTAREALFNALRSPLPYIAASAISEAKQKGWFNDGTLRGQDFRHAQWAGNDLSHADLRGANLSGADLHGAIFHHAMLEQVILTGANLATADFAGATLIGAQLNAISGKAAIFRYANCRSANLDGAKLQRADLAYANLNQSTLSHANLKQAALVGVQLDEARYDSFTKWPKHFYPEVAGAKATDQPSLPIENL
jgi:hypothetical protein